MQQILAENGAVRRTDSQGAVLKGRVAGMGTYSAPFQERRN